ncbi:Ras-related protein RIC1 [Entamoeba marina]
MNPPYQNQIKCIFVGENGSGKTSLIKMIINNEIFDGIAMLYSDFHIKNVIIDRTIYQFLIRDVAGHERFRELTLVHYKNADICVLVYDITNKQSFEKIERYYEDSINTHKEYERPLVYILIGNKCELDNKRQVTYEEARLYAEENKMLFHEISVHQQTNIFSTILDPLFDLIVNHFNERIEHCERRNIEKQPIQKTNNGCFLV